jgi:hypothetical protein
VTPLWIVLGTLGGVSLGAAHTWVQAQAPDLVPRPWGAWLGALWLAPGPLLGLGISWGPLVWAIAMVATGLAAWPMAALVDARRHRLEHLAGVGQREVDARRLLRRMSRVRQTPTNTQNQCISAGNPPCFNVYFRPLVDTDLPFLITLCLDAACLHTYTLKALFCRPKPHSLL